MVVVRQQATLSTQRIKQDQRIDELTAQLKEQAALIQKVNDKVKLNRSAPQTVLNDQ
jgi:uncharacterized coiled-coil protein SlyX